MTAMKVRSLIDDKKKAEVRYAISKGDTSIFRLKKPEPERKEATIIEKSVSKPKESQEKLDTDLLRLLHFPNHFEIAKWRLDAGANPNARLKNRDTALIVAVKAYDKHLRYPIDCPLGKREYEHNMESRHELGIRSVKLLLEAGADVNATDKRGRTAWDHAMRCRDKLKPLFERYGATNLK